VYSTKHSAGPRGREWTLSNNCRCRDYGWASTWNWQFGQALSNSCIEMDTFSNFTKLSKYNAHSEAYWGQMLQTHQQPASTASHTPDFQKRSHAERLPDRYQGFRTSANGSADHSGLLMQCLCSPRRVREIDFEYCIGVLTDKMPRPEAGAIWLVFWA
jgi:hypothetical protein